MNVKLHTPKSLQSGSGLSSLKQLFLSLIATTISIVLTFGTAALIDGCKKADEKREMVMMILNDMSNSIAHVEEIDSAASRVFETQIDILHHPETFDTKKYDLVLVQAAYLNPTSNTVENIFSSNVETINILGNSTGMRARYGSAITAAMSSSGTSVPSAASVPRWGGWDGTRC